jgi:hypothetical protein
MHLWAELPAPLGPIEGDPGPAFAAVWALYEPPSRARLRDRLNAGAGSDGAHRAIAGITLGHEKRGR